MIKTILPTCILALDPALPLFVTSSNDRKVDASDANFVDVLHTNALEKGKLEACGHVDFYANGGITQPGCKSTPEHSKITFVHFYLLSRLYQRLPRWSSAYSVRFSMRRS